MAVASFASPSTICASFRYSSYLPASFVRFQSMTASVNALKQQPLRFNFFSSLNSSKPSGAGIPISSGDGDLDYELLHGLTPSRRREGVPVFVKLPLEASRMISETEGVMKLLSLMKALTEAGVEGVVMEVWWGNVEDTPGHYYWQAYRDLIDMVASLKLKLRVVMAFHQCGVARDEIWNEPWVPLPSWAFAGILSNPDFQFSDRFVRRGKDYISLGCDVLPVLGGRSPIQIYSDFMRNFRDTFREFLGGVITDIQVGMGPQGELRYPCRAEFLNWDRHIIGDFICYDKGMFASSMALAHNAGIKDWGTTNPFGTGARNEDPEESEFFKSGTGTWRTVYGHIFLQWYSQMLLTHGERLCIAANTIFHGTGVTLSAKLGAVFWHYNTESHASELNAGYYNTSFRDGYLPIIQMFGRHGFALCCEGFDVPTKKARKFRATSDPGSFLRHLVLAAKACDVDLLGETTGCWLDDDSIFNLKILFKIYFYRYPDPSISLNVARLNNGMHESSNYWVHFTNFVDNMKYLFKEFDPTRE